MKNKIRTLDFLPEIFQTDSNKQFLNATLDVLTKAPSLTKIDGYIGKKYGYGVNSNLTYLTEINQERSNYQLEPSVVFLKEDTQKAKDLINYPGIVQAIKNNDGNTLNHDRLFKNDIYSWDPLVDLDKLLNYRQYYWLPLGPYAVPITTSTSESVIYIKQTYTVTKELFGYEFDNLKGKNPTITLLRGGQYTFKCDETSQFWIQGISGLDAFDYANNLDTRDILGVINNGNQDESGVIKFNVPYTSSQEQFNLPGDNSVDLVTTSQFNEINGQPYTNIDGITGNISGKTLMFYDNGDLATQNNFYTITVTAGIISLSVASAIPTYEKINVLSGTEFSGRVFYKNGATNEITLIPYLSSFKDTLYYQSGTDPNSVGVIKIIDEVATSLIDVDDILGKATYTSPNNITLTNGLKIRFDFTVKQEEYKYKDFYVEGVGSSIQLLPASKYIVTEVNREIIYRPWDLEPWDTETWDIDQFVGLTPQYITIKRNSQDYNAWSRANKWFHKDVLDITFNTLGRIAEEKLVPTIRAQRPIIEYENDLVLLNHGRKGIGSVQLFDTTIEDPLTTIMGQEVGLPSGNYPEVDGVTLNLGNKVVFAGATDPDVRKKVFIIDYVKPETYDGYFSNSSTTLTLGTGSKTLFVAPSLPYTNGQIIIVQYDPGSYMEGTITSYNSVTGQLVVNVTSFLGGGTYSSWIVNLADNDQAYINFIEDTTMLVTDGSQVHVKYGAENLGTSWYYSEDSEQWIEAQQKTLTNQYPYFDIFDLSDISYSNTNYYTSSNFIGSKLFSYTPGEGANDTILGFPISYSNLSNIGDVSFTTNLNTDVFTYTESGKTITKNVNDGFVHKYLNDGSYQIRSGWIKAADVSYQRQIFEFNLTEESNTITCDVPVKQGIIWNPVNVYLNDDILSTEQYTYEIVENNTVIVLNQSYPKNTRITVAIISDSVSNVGYYEVTENLVHNPFNENITTIDLGDIRSHLFSIFKNIPSSRGNVNGANNLRDIALTQKYGTTIVKNSASMVLPGVFLRKPELNLSKALQFVSDEYYKYKILLLDLVEKKDFDIFDDPSEMLEYAITEIKSTKDNQSPFFWTDMLFSGNPYYVNRYTVNTPTSGLIFDLTKIYDFETANYDGIGVYVKRNIKLKKFGINSISRTDNLVTVVADDFHQYRSGDLITVKNAGTFDGKYEITVINTTSFTYVQLDVDEVGSPTVSSTVENSLGGETRYVQLLKDVDYEVSKTSPSITINYDFLIGDEITIKEYNQTYGSFCPSTPSSLGLYPLYIPKVVLNTTYISPTYFIVGHDGSYHKLYGEYIDGKLTDFRDQVLFELECRIFNNSKIKSDIPLVFEDVFGGQFRNTEYTRDEILEIYSVSFMNWVGANRIDYKKNFYNSTNEFTFNYSKSTSILNNETLKQGFWRGIYQWLYDTDNPAMYPWRMLGFSEKPAWWEQRYGVAPYTSGNIIMWNDIKTGTIWNNGNSYVDLRFARENIMDILPVDDVGNLLSPMDVIVNYYDTLTFNKTWAIGDLGPSEFSYFKSSSWPFDLMKILSVTKPAKFFNFFVDRDRYKYNSTLDQYLYDERQHLNVKNLELYGAGTSKHSYLNWIVEYLTHQGKNGKIYLENIFDNLDVRLSYKLSGFSAKNYLKFFIDHATPNGTNTSLLIPDENYSIITYDNIAEHEISYSSVVIQTTASGWTVWGNSLTKPYFSVLTPKAYEDNKKITVEKSSVILSTKFYEDKVVRIPYGTEFYTKQSLAEFLNNYSAYLTLQGVKFEFEQDGLLYSWDRMIEEFLVWADQNWIIGSLISLNPNSKIFTVEKSGLVVQPLTIQNNNFILNQNLIAVQSQNSIVVRENEKFKVKILSEGDTVSYSNLNLSSIEHVIVFDNQTSFGDLIYNIKSGLRLSRFFVQGYKTAEWQGYIDTKGFILNEDNIEEWKSNQKYSKGRIVTYKNLYWIANEIVVPSVEFDVTKWVQTDYDRVKLGMLPNANTASYESSNYYNSDVANLENDADLLGFGLIGYRQRPYLTSADLSDISQVNIYKNIIEQKGTKGLSNNFRNVTFDQGKIDYTINENWAIKTGDFGAVLNNNFIESILDESLLKGNPTLVGFKTTTPAYADVQQTVYINDLINWGQKPEDENVLPEFNGVFENNFPTAGYVNVYDANIVEFSVDDLNRNIEAIDSITANDIVWVANHLGSWNVFQAESLRLTLDKVENNQDGTSTFIFSSNHSLKVNDIFVVNNFDLNANGFYVVQKVKSISSVIVILNLSTITSISGNGTCFKLVSKRYAQASDAVYSLSPGNEFLNRRIWVDNDIDGKWAVWGTANVYHENTFPAAVTSNLTSKIGSNVAYSEELGYVIADTTNNKIFRIKNNNVIQTIIKSDNFGKDLKVIDDKVFVLSDNKFYYFKLNSNDLLVEMQELDTLASYINYTFAISGDIRWLYINKKLVASPYTFSVEKYHYDSVTELYVTANQSILSSNNQEYSDLTIATNFNGTKIFIGIPQADISAVNSGTVLVYGRYQQRFIADGSTTVFNTQISLYNIDVFVNGIVTNDYTNTTSAVTFNVAPDLGSIIIVSTRETELLQSLTTENVNVNGAFGTSISTNRYGSDFVVGAPYEVSTVNENPNVDGVVYRYTNSGQRYGVILSQSPTVNSGDLIFINGFKVLFDVTSSDVEYIANKINSDTPTNILVTYSGNNLVISTTEDTSTVAFNIIDFMATEDVLARFNITLYTETQKIYSGNLEERAYFGYKVMMNESDSLIISAPVANRYKLTTFDLNNICIPKDQTIFDNNTTTFIDFDPNVGAVYVYDYLPAYNENINNPGKYVFGQILNSANTDQNEQPYFGSSIAFNDNIIVVGTENWDTQNNGFVTSFTTVVSSPLPCQVVKTTNWYLDKKPLKIVDINKLKGVSLFDYKTNSNIVNLDYIDPMQGKHLGAVLSNIDYISYIDPANYNSTSTKWGPKEIGKVWFDTTNYRIYDTYQPDKLYNAENLGKAFPGSSIDLYTWIESLTPPINYRESGFPKSFDEYVTYTYVDNSSNTIVAKYYFWVKNYEIVPQGKTLSPLTLTEYILDPKTSNIPYLGAISTSVIALFNCGDYIRNAKTAVHLGYGISAYLDNAHTNWKLIKELDAQTFLGGLPTVQNQEPSGLYLKFIDSLSGIDSTGQVVPDSALPSRVRSGISFRPRQTMFLARQNAANNYFEYVNNVMSLYPVTEIRNLNYLNYNDGTVDVTDFWNYSYWWEPGYDETVKPYVEVNTVGDLQKIVTSTNYGETANSLLVIQEGTIAKVKANSIGLSEIYVWKENIQNWKRIGLQNGTIQIVNTVTGQAARWIIRWINEVLFTGDLLLERNNTLMLMFNYIQQEAVEYEFHMPWLTKTSMIDVKHKVRNLLPLKTYKRDNQEFLSGYIDEIKPYRVYVKDFVFSYETVELYNTTISDFDLPVTFNKDSLRFESPILVTTTPVNSDEHALDSTIWNNVEYNQWFNNRGLTVQQDDFRIIEGALTIESIDENDGELSVNNINGFPTVGYIRIENETIYYGSIDYKNNKFKNLFRGVNDTIRSSHSSNTPVLLISDPVVIINTGRGYNGPPKITLSVDTSTYSLPVDSAVIIPIMTIDKVVGAQVLAYGSGYLTLPTIEIDGSSIVSNFTGSEIDTSRNEISISGHQFITGDGVIFSIDDETVDYGLMPNQYYYVRVIDDVGFTNNIALYYSYNAALNVNNDSEKLIAKDFQRVILKNDVTSAIGTLTVTAKAVLNISNSPIRMITTKLLFERTSYETKITDWQSGTAYLADVSLVMYQDGLYRCTVSNSDSTFNLMKWVRVYSSDSKLNYADLVKAFYKPTVNMPANDLKLLISGVEYPNSVTKAIDFDDTTSVFDTEIVSNIFTDSGSTNIYDIKGDPFNAGYAPEELVAGVVSDSLTMNIITAGTDLNFRLVVDKYHNSYVFNANAYTKTTLAQDFDVISDTIIYVDDVTKLVNRIDYSVTADANGNVELLTMSGKSVVLIVLSNSAGFTMEILASSISLNVPSAALQSFTVTAYFGNLILLQSEYIGFSSIDLINNSIGGLKRGLLGSPTLGSDVMSDSPIETIGAGTTVQSVLIRDKLQDSSYDRWWYGNPSVATANTTLANNTYDDALFLRRTNFS